MIHLDMLLDAETFLITCDRQTTELDDGLDVVDIWPYVDALELAIEHDVECVRRGDRYDHVVIPTRLRDDCLVVVVDRYANAVLGHHLGCRRALYS